MSKSRFRILGLVALLIAAAAGGWAYVQHHRYKHFAVHQPGMVYRSGWMAPGALRDVIEEHQIRTVVNLCQHDEMTPRHWSEARRAVTQSGARLLEMPMPFTLNPEHPLLDRHIDVLSDPENYPLLVHCQHGVSRTAKYLAIYDVMFRDHSAQESLSAQPLFGREDHNVHVKAFAGNFEDHYRNRQPRGGPPILEALND